MGPPGTGDWGPLYSSKLEISAFEMCRMSAGERMEKSMDLLRISGVVHSGRLAFGLSPLGNHR